MQAVRRFVFALEYGDKRDGRVFETEYKMFTNPARWCSSPMLFGLKFLGHGRTRGLRFVVAQKLEGETQWGVVKGCGQGP